MYIVHFEGGGQTTELWREFNICFIYFISFEYNGTHFGFGRSIFDDICGPPKGEFGERFVGAKRTNEMRLSSAPHISIHEPSILHMISVLGRGYEDQRRLIL